MCANLSLYHTIKALHSRLSIHTAWNQFVYISHLGFWAMFHWDLVQENSLKTFRVISPAGLWWLDFNFWLHWAGFYIPDDSRPHGKPRSAAIQLVVSPADSLKPSKEVEAKDKTHKKIELLLGTQSLALQSVRGLTWEYVCSWIFI
jgi:hypothetical protein